jgi:hypothetical protein
MPDVSQPASQTLNGRGRSSIETRKILHARTPSRAHSCALLLENGNTNLAKIRSELASREQLPISVSAVSIVAVWGHIWALGDKKDNNSCDVYCGLLPGGLGSVSFVFAPSSVIWTLAVILDFVVLIVRQSRLLAGLLLFALFAVPALTLVVEGWLSRIS